MARDTQSISLSWHGDEVLKRINQVTAEAMADGAEVVAAQARENIGQHKLDRPGGYFVTPGAIADQTSAGRFRGANNFAGGYVRTTTLWWIIEWGTARSQPTPWFKPAVMGSRDQILRICERDLQGVRD